MSLWLLSACFSVFGRNADDPITFGIVKNDSRQVRVWGRGRFGTRSLVFGFSLDVWVLSICGEFEMPRSLHTKISFHFTMHAGFRPTLGLAPCELVGSALPLVCLYQDHAHAYAFYLKYPASAWSVLKAKESSFWGAIKRGRFPIGLWSQVHRSSTTGV